MTETILRPLVGLPADTKSDEEMIYHTIGDKYVRAVAEAAHCMPVVLPAIAEAVSVDELLDHLDGIVLTGAVSNVHPGLYGVPPSADFEPYDHSRDALTFALIHRALARGLPLLCICRGFQELNVALGGSLKTEIQRTEGVMDHRVPSSPDISVRYGPAHVIHMTPGGVLERVFGKPQTKVNSLHRQALDVLGKDVIVEARAPDGIIEAISVRNVPGFVVGTQWHPEYEATKNPDSVKLFAAFGDAARAYARRRTEAKGQGEQAASSPVVMPV